eukprot:TRINITY_DN3217_c0_g1_i1.p1 TRINITY_DN3217_c0_g1~~TRINITY_DN3217_c0_g1_i1.p1  ORF type:complete len:234 (-),score=78.70 TRINITY_DN3217_c0_g1_i1:93-716(-)
MMRACVKVSLVLALSPWLQAVHAEEVEQVEQTDLELAQSILKDSDKDGDSKLSKEELVDMVNEDNAGDDLVVVQNREEAIAHIEEQFAAKDTDGDGKLDENELVGMITSYEDLRNSRVDETIQELFSEGDKDKDGFMTKEDLKELILSDFEKSSKDEGDLNHKDDALKFVDSHFDVHDSDKDGKMTMQELSRHIHDFENSKRKSSEL